MSTVDDYEMIELAVTLLLPLEQDPRNVVRILVAKWPEASALQMIYAVSAAAGTIEHVLSGSNSEQAAGDAWRLAGLIGVDLYMMSELHLPHATANDLMSYWLSHDPFFLEGIGR
jgi:hypothetical protein